MPKRLDDSGNLVLSELDLEERAEVIETIGEHLQEIRWAWDDEFLPEMVEVSSGVSIYDEMNEVDLEELNGILSQYSDNQIWVVSPISDSFKDVVFALDGLGTQVHGSALLLGPQRAIWDGYENRSPYLFYVSDKPKLEVAEYEKLIEVHHPSSPCRMSGCNCSAYKHVWIQGSFGCPFCEKGLDCDHTALDLTNCSSWIFAEETTFQFEI
jgi:hypothetical protein